MPGRARRSRAALVCAAVCIPSLAAAGDAAAVVVPCNSIITTSVTLSNDIRDCHRAIRVDADNVTINLNGHTISNADSSQQSVAIDSQGHTGLTVRNGRIVDEVLSVEGSGLRMTELTLVRSFTSFSGDRVRLTASSLQGSGVFGTGTRTTISGLTMHSSNVFLYGGFDPDTGAPVAGGSRIVGNRFTNLSGLQASFSPGLLVSRNVGTGVIQVDGGDAKTLISGNRLSGGLGVINVYTFDPLTPGGVQVVGNRVSGANGPGINVCCATTTGATPAGDVIRANTVTGSAEGIRVESSIGTRVLNNVTGSNTNGSGGAGGNGYGIHVTGSSRDVQVIGNRANNNQHEGIEVGNDRDFDQPADVTGTIVRDNIANFNGVSVNPDTASPGLRVRDPLGQVFGNTAVGNGNFFQIRATIGITGGGNHAAACAPGYLC